MLPHDRERRRWPVVGGMICLLLGSCHQAPAPPSAPAEPPVSPPPAGGAGPGAGGGSGDAGRGGSPAPAPVADAAVVGGGSPDGPTPAPPPAGMPPDAAPPSATARAAAAQLVGGLTIERFRQNIKDLATMGDRLQGTPSYDRGAGWLEQQLTAAGYTVGRVDYTFGNGPRYDLYATKVGSKTPDRMYIVSAHLDGRGGGGAADDDGSGVSAVLEMARAFAGPGVSTEVSLRFAFWDSEETGFQGAHAYINQRGALQGMEDPPGSGKFPEPRWLGMIQHDMLLYDHGMPPGPSQRADANIDIDFQDSSRHRNESRALAEALAAGSKVYAGEYAIELGDNMEGTDSVAFEDAAPSVSVREADRILEIIRGSNPYHHKPTDVYESYSDEDFRFGFSALKTSMGTIAELAGAQVDR